jgi:hypothetical protein
MRKRLKETNFIALGLVTDVLLIIGGILLSMTFHSFAYRGYCPDLAMMSGDKHPCGFIEYLATVSAIDLLIFGFSLWWVTVPLLLVPPMVGCFLHF